MSKNLVRTLGGAAALVSVAGLASAQPTPVRRDTVVTKRVLVLPGQTDSIMILSARIGQEAYGSDAWIKAATALDSLLVHGLPAGFVRFGGMPGFALRSFPVAKGWVGLNTQGPAATMIDSTGSRHVRFFAYQDIISVDPGSPAERVGIAPGDMLVAYNGVDLINHEFNFGDILVAKKRLDLTIRRDGEVKDYSLVVASVPEDVRRRHAEMDRDMNQFYRIELRSPAGAIMVRGDSDGPRAPVRATKVGQSVVAGPMRGRGMSLFGQKMFLLQPDGLFGASLSNVNEQLAKVIKLPKGVLVNEVPEDTPAYRAGLRMGDVIVTCDDDSVITVGELRELVAHRLADHAVALQVVRQQRVKKLTVSWPDAP